MKLTDIRNLTNSRLAGEQLTYSALLPYLDAVVDDINSKLHTKFATFTEINPTGVGGATDYTEFPDKYIRTVVCVGAAWRWYVDDEEGIDTAVSLKQQYDNNLFVMVRDYGPLVPEGKKADDNTGYLKDPYSTATCSLNPEVRYNPVEGLPGVSVEAMELRHINNALHLYAKLVGYTLDGGFKWIDCGVIPGTSNTIAENNSLPAGSYIGQLGIEIKD